MNVITKGAIMDFEDQQGLKTDGVAGPTVWSALLADVASGHADANPYHYVYVSEADPETVTVYQSGSVVYQTLANTGISVAPTAQGHLHRLRPLRVDDDVGHQPRRQQVQRPRGPLGQLFQWR